MELEIDGINTAISAKEISIQEGIARNQRVEDRQAILREMTALSIKDMQDKLERPYIKEGQVILDIDEGIIQEIACEKYSYIGSNGPSYIISILDTSSIEVVADLPEEFIKDVKVGNKCRVIPYYDSLMTLESEVTRIEDQAIKEDGEVLVKVHIALTDKDVQLKPGLSVDVSLDIE